MAIKSRKINGILKYYKKIMETSENNISINDELEQLDLKRVQIILTAPDYTFWVNFGNGKFDYGDGEIKNPDILVNCKTSLFRQILKQKKFALTEFTKKNMIIQGDIQYAVVYFDFLNYSSDLIKNNGGEFS